MMHARGVSVVPICMLAAVVLCAAGPTWGDVEFVEFPEFRYTSALPGGGWGVMPTGEPGFDGALQINVPVAYTPHEGFIIGYSSGSFSTTPKLAFSGAGSNGTATLAAGFGRPGRGIYVCEMGTSSKWEPAENIQVQIRAEEDKWPAVAIGLQDIFGHRDRATTPGHAHHTESPYVVATRQMAVGERTAYLTLGLGWGRFHSGPFAGVSYRASEKVTAMAEYDGYNANLGAALDLSSIIAEHTTAFVGLVDLDRTVIGLTYVHR